VLNFGKDFVLSSKIIKGSCSVIPDIGMFLLEGAASDSGFSLPTEGTWAFEISVSLFKNSFLTIIF